MANWKRQLQGLIENEMESLNPSLATHHNLLGEMLMTRCKYAFKSQKSCQIMVKTMNFVTYVFSWHLKVMLIIPSCAKWLIWMLRNSN
jgi:hypothetical protein